MAAAQVQEYMPEWEPSCFLVDAADAEIAAIGAVFGSAVKIFLCFWHVQRAWRANLCTKVGYCPSACHPFMASIAGQHEPES